MTAKPDSSTTPPELPPIDRAHVLHALRQWHGGHDIESQFTHRHLFREIQRRTGSDSRRYVQNVLLRDALARLAVDDEQAATLLERRFLDNTIARSVANELNVSQAKFFEMQGTAVDRLTDMVNQMEREARRAHQQTLARRLPLPQNPHLIGVDVHLTELLPKLTNPTGDWIIALEGMGGIGKTTLANVLARRAIEQDAGWAQVGWVTARQAELSPNGAIALVENAVLSAEALIQQLVEQLLPDLPRPADYSSEQALHALEQYLNDNKCLLVVDNLETVTDVERLLPTLQRLTNPSKCILTSRWRLYAASGVFHYPVAQLSADAALALVRTEAATTNLPAVLAASDADLLPIYATVGGNPLALRLVVGQLHIYELNEILTDLQEARGETAENLYTFIYRRLWDRLSEPARNALIAMILVSDQGDTLQELQATCGLPPAALRGALTELVTLNLVESRGGLLERRYTIHALTRTFLHKQVVLWE